MKKFRVQRGLQQSALPLTRSSNEKYWKNANFCVFDAPEHEAPFEERIKFLEKLKIERQWPSNIQLVEQILCKNRDHMNQYFTSVIHNKGEGLMLREPNSLYEFGRSNSMKRYKEYIDTECLVKNSFYPHGFQCVQYVKKN